MANKFGDAFETARAGSQEIYSGKDKVSGGFTIKEEKGKNPLVPVLNKTIEASFCNMAESKEGYAKDSAKYNTAVGSIAIAFVANSLPYGLIEDPFIKGMFVSFGRSPLYPAKSPGVGD